MLNAHAFFMNYLLASGSREPPFAMNFAVRTPDFAEHKTDDVPCRHASVWNSCDAATGVRTSEHSLK